MTQDLPLRGRRRVSPQRIKKYMTVRQAAFIGVASLFVLTTTYAPRSGL